MIALKGITKNYYLSKTNVVRVLKGVDINFRKSEFVSILGASGCGKTTLLNIIGGLDDCDSGEIIVGGVSTANFSTRDWDNYRNKRIGFVFQSYNLIPHLNIVRNVEMPLVLAGMKKSESRKKAVEVLESVGLKEQIYKKPLQLSGGQMQRVALARALITDPDIILADEPTGALDAESGVMVMDLLRNVAKDRLVIMVTHNDSLANEYSTRIINLSGGVVSGDSNPYYGETERFSENTESAEPDAYDAAAEPLNEPIAETTEAVPDETHGGLTDETAESGLKTDIPKTKTKKRKEKAHLSFKTALELSARTLASKKVRSSLTSFAGSIGIIGIILVLAISNGVNAYIKNLEEGSLSMYPLTIEESSVSLMSLMEKVMGSNNADREEHPIGDTIYTNKVLGGIMENITSLAKPNDLVSFKEYLDANFDDSLGNVKYEYGIPMHVYADDPKSDERLMKTEPFIDVMDSALDTLPLNMGNMLASFKEKIEPYAEMMSAWAEMSSNESLIRSQYELIGSSKWPRTDVYQDENGDMVAEVVVITDSKNQLNDYSLFMLGLKSQDDIWAAIFDQNDSFSSTTYKVGDIIGKEYYVLGGYDYFEKGEEDEFWTKHDKTLQDAEFITSHYSVKAKVVGVIRPSKGSAAMMNGAIGYCASLKNYLIQRAEEHPAVIEQKANFTEEGEKKTYYDITTGLKFGSTASYKERIEEMGIADLSKPTSIMIYSSSFANKEKIVDFIKEYNEENAENGSDDKTIKYTDMLSTMMSFVNTMSDAISKVLIGFISISLIVSSIMIAVIIYTSVLERRKEVGILRSIGARKHDVTIIFMSESGMLGLSSGLLGVFIGWLITIPINALLKATVGIGNLAIVEWWHALVMTIISFTLSIVAGVVPAFIAAKQDPAVALRTE